MEDMRLLAHLLHRQKNIWLFTAMTGNQLGQMTFCTEDGNWYGNDFLRSLPLVRKCGEQVVGDVVVLCEHIVARKKLVVCGGGHISVSIVKLGSLLGYEVTVLEDRKEFAQPERFPEANCVKCGDYSEMLQAFSDIEDVSYVIVTRGHAADQVCLREILKKQASYIGMIGSRIKNKAIFEELRQEGITESQLQKVHAPIGLKIGARTPEEIAVSIAAELVAVRAQDMCTTMSTDMLQALQGRSEKGLLATIIRKRGSAPRGVGARMLFLENGAQYGTIGGGLAEHAICIIAKNPPKTPEIQKFVLQNEVAASCGMICGGSVEILLQPLF